MSFNRQKIDCTGKPYRHVGWHDNGKPKFVKKSQKELAKELEPHGVEPVYDEDGWFKGTTKMATLPEGAQLPDHMLDSKRFIDEIHAAPTLFQPGRQFGKEFTMTTKPFGNPCREIPLGGEPGYLHPPTHEYGKQTLMGHRLYDGPAVDVTVWQDDASMECEVMIKQKRCMTEKTINFGPLSCQLSELFSKGYWLEVKLEYKHFNPRATRPVRVYLSDGVDRYRLYKIDWYELQAMGKTHGQYDLGSALTSGTNLLRTHSSARYPKPVIQRVEVPVERDPFEVLAERYPRGSKKPYDWDTMVGNRTLRERFDDHISNR